MVPAHTVYHITGDCHCRKVGRNHRTMLPAHTVYHIMCKHEERTMMGSQHIHGSLLAYGKIELRSKFVLTQSLPTYVQFHEKR